MAHKTIALTIELRELRDTNWGAALANVLMVILRRRQNVASLA